MTKITKGKGAAAALASALALGTGAAGATGGDWYGGSDPSSTAAATSVSHGGNPVAQSGSQAASQAGAQSTAASQSGAQAGSTSVSQGGQGGQGGSASLHGGDQTANLTGGDQNSHLNAQTGNQYQNLQGGNQAAHLTGGNQNLQGGNNSFEGSQNLEGGNNSFEGSQSLQGGNNAIDSNIGVDTNTNTRIGVGVDPNITVVGGSTHSTVSPNINPTINPNINPTINPTINPNINPTINPNISPELNQNTESTGVGAVHFNQTETSNYDSKSYTAAPTYFVAPTNLCQTGITFNATVGSALLNENAGQLAVGVHTPNSKCVESVNAAQKESVRTKAIYESGDTAVIFSDVATRAHENPAAREGFNTTVRAARAVNAAGAPVNAANLFAGAGTISSPEPQQAPAPHAPAPRGFGN